MGTTPVPETSTDVVTELRFWGGQVPWLSVGLIVSLLCVLYASTLIDLAKTWWNVPSFSHGLLVPPLAVFVAWQARHRTLSYPAVPDSRGLYLVLLSCLLFLLGRLGAEYFLPRISFVLLLVALTWTFWGLARLRTLSFPFLLLATMVPIPVLVYNSVATPLQLLASEVSTRFAQACGIAVYQDGNIIHLANTSLGVEEACSGLNSLSALVVASLLLGQVYGCRPAVRIALFALSVPISIAVNILRVTGTAIMADSHVELAMGFYHSFSGWLVFVAGFGTLYLTTKLLCFLFDRKHGWRLV